MTWWNLNDGISVYSQIVRLKVNAGVFDADRFYLSGGSCLLLLIIKCAGGVMDG